MARIQMLRDLISTCSRVNDKRSNAFLKALKFVKDLGGPQFVRYLGIIRKEQLYTELNTIKSSWTSEFDEFIEFP
jgi:hypothetical protein